MSDDPRLDRALARFQVISAYLAIDPPRGQRGQLRKAVAGMPWTNERGEPMRVSPETIRAWVRRYRRGGLEALMDKRREKRGVEVLPPEVIEKACALKREVPERTLDKLIRILEDLELAPKGLVRRSTLHRALKARGLSRRPRGSAEAKDLDRFEAAAPNDLWQSDLLSGPYLPDPERPGKVRRASLYAFLDDHSRLLLHGRFSFKGDLPALELVFRRSVQKYGVPRATYYDNGQVYRSKHMKQVLAALGVHRKKPIHTVVNRPEGHGKIEALNKFIRGNFLSELKASTITTLDELNEAFVAWVALEYNTKNHSETGQAPLDRWRAGADRVEYADEERIRQGFTWRETRKADKSGILSLFGVKFQVGPDLSNRRVQVRYDPEDLHEIEVWYDEAFRERLKPFEVAPWRRPKPPTAPPPSAEPVVDWLAHLREQHADATHREPDPRAWRDELVAKRQANVVALVDLLAERLDPHVVDVPAIRAFAARFGPFDLEAAAAVLDRLLERHPADLHVQFYLEHIRKEASR